MATVNKNTERRSTEPQTKLGISIKALYLKHFFKKFLIKSYWYGVPYPS